MFNLLNIKIMNEEFVMLKLTKKEFGILSKSGLCINMCMQIPENLQRQLANLLSEIDSKKVTE